MTPILSVILPIYNVEPYLRQCLESVYSQTVPGGMEVICVNDGSTDGSRAIIQEFKDKYPETIVVDRENGGLPAARNSGYKVATGKYIYYLDSDDYLYPEVLAKMVAFAEENELDVANFNVYNSNDTNYFDLGIYQKETMNGIGFFRWIYNYYFALPVSPVWMYLYRKDFLDNNKIVFKEGIVLEDNHYTLRVLLLAKRVKLLNIAIQYHRIQRPGAETHTVTRTQVDSLLFTCRDLYRFYKAHNCEEKVFYNRIFLIYLNITARVLILKNFQEETFLEEDIQIMRDCLISDYYCIHFLLIKWRLFRIYNWYINETKPSYLRKNLRRIARVYWKVFAK